MPHLASIQLELKYLIPDFFPNVPIGMRTNVDRKQSQWFLISSSLIEWPIPSKIHTTLCWKEERVVDWSKVKGVSIPDPLILKGKELREYVLSILFRYSIGIPDPADRNLLLETKTRKIYSTDEEGIGRETDYWNGLKKRKCKLIQDYVNIHHKDIAEELKEWLEAVEKNEEKVKRILRLSDISWLLERLRKIQSVEGINSIFQEK
jgi:hypothetical protein